jgi:hypothetical protein
MANGQTYEARRAAIIADPAASFWLKGAIAQLDRRDPCDALCDVGCLLGLAQQRLNGCIFPDQSEQRSARR